MLITSHSHQNRLADSTASRLIARGQPLQYLSLLISCCYSLKEIVSSRSRNLASSVHTSM